MMFEILKYLLETCGRHPFRENDIRVAEVVFNLALPPSHNLVDGGTGSQFAQITFYPTRKLLKFAEGDEPEEVPAGLTEKEDAHTFGNLKDLLQNKSNGFRHNAQAALAEITREAKRRGMAQRNSI